MSNLKLTQYIDELEKFTQAVASNIQHADYEEIENYTILREQLVRNMTELGAELTMHDKERIKKICSYDKIIADKISSLKQEAGDWLFKQGMIKDQRTAYNSAYTMNSMFFDQKN